MYKSNAVILLVFAAVSCLESVWCTDDDLNPDSKMLFIAPASVTLMPLEKEDEHHLRIGYIQAGAILRATKAENKVILKGPYAAFIRECVKWMNINYTLYHAADNSWGYRQENGSFTGLMGMIERKEIGVAFLALSPTPMKYEVADFTTYARVAIQIILSVPIQSTPSIFKAFFALHWKVWCVLGLTTFLVMSVTSAIVACKTRQISAAEDALWLVQRVLLTQEVSPMPKSYNLKFIYVTWMFACWIISLAFGSQLLSTLLIKSPPLLIDPLKDFQRFPNVTPCINSGGLSGAYYRSSSAPEVVEIRRRAKERGTIFGNSTIVSKSILRKVASGTHAIIFNKDMVLDATKDEDRQNFHFSKEEIQFGVACLPIRKNLSLKLRRRLDAGHV